jgi:hypothetical protein
MSRRYEPLADRLRRFDGVLTGASSLCREGYMQQVIDPVKVARRFEFDVEASAAAEHLIVHEPQRLLDNLDLVQQPYDPLWIETMIQPGHWFEDPVIIKGKDNGSDRTLTYPRDWRGVPIDQGLVHEVTTIRSPVGSGRWEPFVTWERYQIDGLWPLQDQDTFFASYGIINWRLWVLDDKLDKFPAWAALSDEQVRTFLDHCVIELDGVSKDTHDFFQEKQTFSLMSLHGAFLIPLACLVLLNTPKLVREIEVPASKRFISGKMRQVREHTDIQLKVGHQEVVRYLTEPTLSNDSTRRRLHDVRGHFAHNHVARQTACVHPWIQDDATRWHCPRCGGRRWWKPKHERGDEALGRVPPKPYAVTT